MGTLTLRIVRTLRTPALGVGKHTQAYATQRMSMLGGLLASNIRTRRLSAN